MGVVPKLLLDVLISIAVEGKPSDQEKVFSFIAALTHFNSKDAVKTF